jgi:hypothetical protein
VLFVVGIGRIVCHMPMLVKGSVHLLVIPGPVVLRYHTRRRRTTAVTYARRWGGCARSRYPQLFDVLHIARPLSKVKNRTLNLRYADFFIESNPIVYRENPSKKLQ